MKKIMKSKKLVLVAALFAVLCFSLLVVPLARTTDRSFFPPGSESYGNLILSAQPDFLGDAGINVFHILLNVVGELYFVFVQIIVALLSLFLLNNILKEFKLRYETRIYVLALLLLSPIFIYSHTAFVSYSFLMLFSISGFFFFMKKRFIWSALSLLLLSFFDVYVFLAVLILLLFYALKINLFHKYVLAAAPPITIFLLFIIGFWGSGKFYALSEIGSVSSLFSDFGALMGYSIFIVLLSLIEIFSFFEKKKYTPFVVFLCVLFIFSFYIDSLRVIANLFFVISAAIALESIFKRVWSWEFLRQVTALIILCTLLFSAVAYANLLINSEPSRPLMHILDYLKKRDNDYPVLSHTDNTCYLEYFTGHNAFSDLFQEGDSSFLEDLDILFYSIKIDKSEVILRKYNIGYVFLTPEMKKGKVWSKSEQGLLFIFENSNLFINLYESNGYELWGYSAKENIV